TVFLCVPDLQAVPVGRISTALRATRSGFQAGFRDQDGAEIPFDNLGQIRDLARRAYLAAGLGPGAPGAIAGPVPSPDVDGGPGSAYLEEEFAEFVEPMRFDHPDDVVPHYLERPLEIAVDRFAGATLLEWEGLLAHEDPDRLRAFVGWNIALARAGVFVDQRPG